jgi:hypothetical protein
MQIKAVLQTVELMEYAEMLGLDFRDNETVYRWIEEGHAAKFSEHFDACKDDITAHCASECGQACKGDPFSCPLKRELHALLKDSADW